eukprot:gene11089-12257_t
MSMEERSQVEARREGRYVVDLSNQGLTYFYPSSALVRRDVDINKIRKLTLCDNTLSVVPNTISQFTSLEELDVSRNRISWISGELAHLSKLKIFVARSNQLRNLPKELESMQSLEILNLSGNLFGGIPREVFSLRSLKELYMGGNSISSIPDSIQQIKSLFVLYLGGNRLKRVPESLGSLANLQALILCDNQLEQIPRDEDLALFFGEPKNFCLAFQQRRQKSLAPRKMKLLIGIFLVGFLCHFSVCQRGEEKDEREVNDLDPSEIEDEKPDDDVKLESDQQEQEEDDELDIPSKDFNDDYPDSEDEIKPGGGVEGEGGAAEEEEDDLAEEEDLAEGGVGVVGAQEEEEISLRVEEDAFSLADIGEENSFQLAGNLIMVSERDTLLPVTAQKVRSCINPSGYSLLKLAKCWAPMIYLAAGEIYKPSSVDFFLPHVKMVRSNGRSLQQYNLNAYNLQTGASNYYLTSKTRLRYHTSTFWWMKGQNPSHVPIYTLYRTFTQSGKTVKDFVYWAFFPYNRGKGVCLGGATGGFCIGKCKSFGNHVGDWEHVTVRLVNDKPSAMYIGAHNFGGTFLWNSGLKTFAKGNDRVKFSSDGHPIVFCAYGSHGFWTKNKESVYKKIKNGEKLTDYTSTGTIWKTWNNLQLIHYKRNGGYTGRHTWLNYKGRWGNKKSGCGIFGIYEKIANECIRNSGPTSPNYKGVMTSNVLSKK